MALKQIDKSELVYDQGYFMLGGSVVALTYTVARQIQVIDDIMKECQLIQDRIDKHEAVIAASKMPKGPQAKPGKFDFCIETKTPLLEQEEAYRQALLDEVDAKLVAEKANDELRIFSDLAFFVNSGKVFIDDSITPDPLRLAVIEDPLKLDNDDVILAVVNHTKLKMKERELAFASRIFDVDGDARVF